jgi:hypothetical protein
MPDFFSQSPGGEGDAPDFLTALLSGTGGAGGPGGGLPPQFAQMFGGQPGSTPVQIQPPKQKTWTDRLLPLVHLLSMVALAFYAIFVLEPRIRQGYSSIYTAFSDRSTWTSIGQVDWNGWAALSRGKQGDSTTSAVAQGMEDAWLGSGRGVATVVSVDMANNLRMHTDDHHSPYQQIMYLFLTVELILQTSAIVILKVSHCKENMFHTREYAANITFPSLDSTTHALPAQQHHALSTSQICILRLYRHEILVSPRTAIRRSSCPSIVRCWLYSGVGVFPARWSRSNQA